MPFRSPVSALLLAMSTAMLPVTAEIPRDSAAQRGHRVVVLDPVDLQAQAASRPWGDTLRGIFASLPGWKPAPLDSMEERFRENKRDFSSPCHEYQCAFDAGINLLSEFVVFGSVTRVRGWYAYTFDVVHVASAQAVWSKAGEMKIPAGADGAASLKAELRGVLAPLNPDSLKITRRQKRGTITVLDLGEGTAVSRVLAERMATHLRATRSFNIMNQAEQDELLAALEIEKADFSPTDSGIYWLGGKMGVTHLVYSQLSGKDPAYGLGLAFYDMEEKRKALDWPARGGLDFGKLARREEEFFSVLFTPVDMAPPTQDEAAWFRAGAGAGVALSALMAVFAVESSKPQGRWLFGGMSAALMTGAGLSLVFSFQ